MCFSRLPLQDQLRHLGVILSCFCSEPHLCKCFGPQTVHMEAAAEKPASTSTSVTTSQSIADIHDGLNGKWCVVTYDGDPYPGIIQDVGSNSCALVTVMSRTGRNGFFWPMRENVIWYQHKDVVRLVPEPQQVTKRHVMLDTMV